MSAKMLFLDDETFSPTPITNGLHRYAESVEVMIRALALDDGAVLIRDLTPGGEDWVLVGGDIAPAPLELVLDCEEALEDDSVEVWAQNSSFDRTVERWAGLRIRLHRWRDTMIQALAHSLPGSLGALCDVLKIPTDSAKDKAGKALIQLFCKPPAGNLKRGRATRETHPAEWRRFLVYAGQDIIAMRECHKRMPKWNYPGNAAELALWHLDQRINDRGVAIDVDLAEAAVRAVDLAQIDLRAQTFEMTAGEVESATRRDALLLHVLTEYGVDLPDMQKATLERRIADPDLPDGLRELLRVRLQATTTSTSKYKTLIKGTSSDGRLRGLLQFCGAARTGRWAGRLWQPQNLPRPVLKQDEIDAGIEALKDDMAHLLVANVMQLTSSAIRGCIVAPPGKKLVVADLSNIEGRVLAWLAGENWKIKAFAEYDAGTGFDLYALSYAKSFGVSAQSVMDDKKAGGNQRQVGKVQELALGYEGGVGAFVTFAAAYSIDLEKLAETAQRAIPGAVWGQANIMLGWHRDRGRDPAHALGLSDRAWLVCESFKLGWRDAHPNIRAFWKDLDATVREAITTPGTTFLCGRLKIRRDGAWLRIVLPSGRALCYPSPALVAEKKKRTTSVEETADGLSITEEETGTGRTKITYMGMNQYTRKWDRIDTYGGKIAENCLAEGTEVLTMVGWCPIELVADLPVWDGIEWVEHAGCIYKGNMLVLSAYGVTMTPDHKVLTKEGWKNASSCAGLDRADVGLPDGYSLHRIGERAPVYMGSEMQVRCAQTYASIGIPEAAEARNRGLLWLHASGEYRSEEHLPRHDSAPGVCGMAQHERPLPLADAPGVPQLRGAGYRGVRALARIVRKLLGGYGAELRDGPDAGAQEKRPRLRPGELPLGGPQTPSEQPPHHGVGGNTRGADISGAGGRALRHRAEHSLLALGERVAGGARTRPVYDLMDCGPRNRFVVRGADGHALIVHNCTQALARDVMASNMPDIEAAGYEIVLSVHDELLTETPDDECYSHEHLAELMATAPVWADGMPLAAAGFEAYRYKKD